MHAALGLSLRIAVCSVYAPATALAAEAVFFCAVFLADRRFAADFFAAGCAVPARFAAHRFFNAATMAFLPSGLSLRFFLAGFTGAEV